MCTYVFICGEELYIHVSYTYQVGQSDWLLSPLPESGVLPRQKRRYASHSAGKDTMAVYHSLTQVVETLALLLESQSLTDTIILQVHEL